MIDMLICALLWIGVIGCGLMAGVYFAFSVFIMRAFASLDPAAGIAAMNAINRDILRSLFMPLFFGTTFAAIALIVLAILQIGRPAAPAMLAGGTLYVIGMFMVTMLGNVPLNNRLIAADPSTDKGRARWTAYLRDWTRWNHVRALSSTASSALFVWTLAA